MNSKLKLAQDNFIEAIGQLASSLGLNRVAGQLYALLYLNESPLSLDEMVEELKISKGHVSTNIRALENWGAVRKVWVKGDRKDYYEVDLNVPRIIADRLKIGLGRRLQDALEMINKIERRITQIEKDLAPQEKREAMFFKERIQRVKKLSKSVERILKNVSILIP